MIGGGCVALFYAPKSLKMWLLAQISVAGQNLKNKAYSGARYGISLIPVPPALIHAKAFMIEMNDIAKDVVRDFKREIFDHIPWGRIRNELVIFWYQIPELTREIWADLKRVYNAPNP